MATADRRGRVDLSGINLGALRPPDGSALERALARLRLEEVRGGPGYARFMNETSMVPEGADVGDPE